MVLIVGDGIGPQLTKIEPVCAFLGLGGYRLGFKDDPQSEETERLAW